MPLIYKLSIITLMVYIFFTLLGCATIDTTNSIKLKDWGEIIIKDEVYLRGKKVNGYHFALKRTGNNPYHFVAIARDTPNWERTLIHELLHAQEYKHKTKEEKKVFNKKMSEYGF